MLHQVTEVDGVLKQRCPLEGLSGVTSLGMKRTFHLPVFPNLVLLHHSHSLFGVGNVFSAVMAVPAA